MTREFQFWWFLHLMTDFGFRGIGEVWRIYDHQQQHTLIGVLHLCSQIKCLKRSIGKCAGTQMQH